MEKFAFRLWFLCCVAACAVSPPCLMAADGTEQGLSGVLLDRIMTTLRKRQQSIHSAYVEVKGEGFVPRGTYSEIYPDEVGPDVQPSDDYTYPEKISWLLDFDHNRVRKESKMETFVVQEQRRRFAPRHIVEIYDGKQIKVFDPKELNTGNISRRAHLDY
jgi:hypothetical protein